jgi:hypothetical protein
MLTKKWLTPASPVVRNWSGCLLGQTDVIIVFQTNEKLGLVRFSFFHQIPKADCWLIVAIKTLSDMFLRESGWLCWI